MEKISLITGANGQDGSYLSELLLDKGYKVYGMIRRSSTDTTERIAHLINDHNFELVEGDITDATGIHKIIEQLKPDEVYNLAAMSHVGTSFNEPVSTFQIDAVGPLNLLEAIRQSSPKSKFYQASTSELYGDTKECPQNEETSFNPCSPYAVAKLAAHKAVSTYRRAYGLFACAGILFNHESPRRGETFVTRKITKYVANIINFRNKYDRNPVKSVDILPLYLGNLDAKRDWSHAKDMIRGMWMIMQHSKPDDFVLASGYSRTITQFLLTAFTYGCAKYKEYVEIDPQFYRPADVNLLQGDASKAKRVLGWEPEISFDKLVDSMVESDLKLICPVLD